MNITLNMATTDDLKKAVELAIKEAGYTKTALAGILHMSRQALNQTLAKKNFSIDDANMILSHLGYKVSVTLEKM